MGERSPRMLAVVISLIVVVLSSLIVGCGDDDDDGGNDNGGNSPNLIEQVSDDHRLHPYVVEWEGTDYLCFVYSHDTAEEGGVSCLELGESLEE